MRFPNRWLMILAAVAVAGSSTNLYAADEPALEAAQAGAAEGKEAEDPFKIPEGTDPQTLQSFMQGMARIPPKGNEPEQILKHYRKMEGVTQEIFKREIDDNTARMAVELRLAILNALAAYNDEAAEKDRNDLIAALLKDERPTLRERGAVFQLAQRISEIGLIEEDETRKQLIADVAAYAAEGELSQERVQLAMLTARNLEQFGDRELAALANNEFAKVLEARNNEELKAVIDLMRGTAKRLNLVGNTMPVKGKTHEGKDFDIGQYQGKVVLVDFWATWCVPCLEELPHVKELYDAYHDKGFEVVGVNLDRDKNDLVAYLQESPLPWVQLFPEGEEVPAADHPLATEYGVNAIPTAILIGKDGKVVSLEARGQELTDQLEKILGPVEKKETAPPAEKPE